jgi:hypothetical protein
MLFLHLCVAGSLLRGDDWARASAQGLHLTDCLDYFLALDFVKRYSRRISSGCPDFLKGRYLIWENAGMQGRWNPGKRGTRSVRRLG